MIEMDPFIIGIISTIIIAIWVIIKIFLKISAWIFWTVVALLVGAVLFVINLFG